MPHFTETLPWHPYGAFSEGLGSVNFLISGHFFHLMKSPGFLISLPVQESTDCNSCEEEGLAQHWEKPILTLSALGRAHGLTSHKH